jgi:hypothetical protein
MQPELGYGVGDDDQIVVSNSDLNPFARWLGQVCVDSLKKASMSCRQMIEDAMERDRRLARGGQTEEWSAGADDNVAQNSTIPIDAATLDTVRAMFMQEFASSGGYRVIASGLSSQDDAEATKAYMDAWLDELNISEVVCSVFGMVEKHEYAGMHIGVERRVSYETRPKTIRLGEEDAPADHILTGYSRFDPETGQPAVGVYVPVMGTKVEEIVPFVEGLSCYELYIPCPERKSLKDQPAIHILSVVDKSDLRKVASVVPEKIVTGKSIYNVASLGFEDIERGDVVFSGQEYDEPTELWRTWLDPTRHEPPDDVTDEDYSEFLKQYKVLRPFQPGVKWCVLHDSQGFIYGIEENPQIKQDVYPVTLGSFYESPSSCIGSSLYGRIEDICKTIESLFCTVMWSLNKRISPPWLYNTGSGIDSEQFAEALRKRFRGVKVSNADDIDSAIKFLDLPNALPELKVSLQLLYDFLQRVALPDIASGLDTAGTATEAQINSGRASTRMSLPFRSFAMNQLKPMLEIFRDVCLRWATGPKFVRLAGESGGNMARSGLVHPDMLTDQFRIAPTFSYEFMNEARMGTVIMGVLKMLQGYGVGSNTATKIARRILQSVGMNATTIDETLGDVGRSTDIFMEMEILADSMTNTVRVREDDNHRAALKAIELLKQAKPEVADWPNVAKYEAQHYVYLQAEEEQMQQEMMMRMMAASMRANEGSGGDGGRLTPGRAQSDLLAMSKDAPMTEAGLNSAVAQGAGSAGGDMTDMAQGGMTGLGAI